MEDTDEESDCKFLTAQQYYLVSLIFIAFYSGKATDLANLNGELYAYFQHSLASGDHALQIEILKFMV